MRFLSPILYLSLASSVYSVCPDDHGGLGADRESACAPSPSYCRVKCTQGAVPECAFVAVTDSETGLGEVEDADTGAINCPAASVTDVNSFSYGALDATSCEAACQASTEAEVGSRCRFWRLDWVFTVKSCSLMIEAECTKPDYCGSRCNCGDLGCNDPDPEPCKGEIQYDPANVHWTCRTSGGLHISAYKPGDMLDGSICQTTHKCADWQEEVPEPLKKHLQVECHNAVWSASNGTGGSTEQYIPVLGEGEDAGKTVIKEPTCTGGGTVLQVVTAQIQETGAQLICTTPPTPVDGDPDHKIISPPNSCILLCDFQLGMTIDSVFGEEGFIVFQDGEGNDFPALDGNENVRDGSRVDCWPERKLEKN